MPAPETASLWSFATRLYARPEVAQACLRLQDERHVRVTLLLAALWLADNGRPLDEPRALAMCAAVADWQALVVDPVRAARRALRRTSPLPGDPETETVRQRLLDAEIELERLELLALERLALECSADAERGRADAREAGKALLGRHNLRLLASPAAMGAEADILLTAAFG